MRAHASWAGTCICAEFLTSGVEMLQDCSAFRSKIEIVFASDATSFILNMMTRSEFHGAGDQKRQKSMGIEFFTNVQLKNKNKPCRSII